MKSRHADLKQINSCSAGRASRHDTCERLMLLDTDHYRHSSPVLESTSNWGCEQWGVFDIEVWRTRDNR